MRRISRSGVGVADAARANESTEANISRYYVDRILTVTAMFVGESCRIYTMNAIESLSLLHFRSVLNVAEEGSVSGAAPSIGVSPSQVSRYVAQAERQLGVELFARRGPTIQLTPAGKDLIPRLREAMGQMERVALRALRLRRGSAGHLVLGYTRLTAYLGLPHVLSLIHAEFPDVDISLSPLPDRELEEALASEQVDLALMTLPFESGEWPFCTVAFDPLHIAASQDLHLESEVSLSDPRLPPILVAPFTSWPGTYRKVLARCERKGIVPVFQESGNDALGRMAMALTGRYAALVSQIRRSHAPDGVTLHALEGFDDIGFTTVLSHGPHPSAWCQRVFDTLAELTDQREPPRANRTSPAGSM